MSGITCMRKTSFNPESTDVKNSSLFLFLLALVWLDSKSKICPNPVLWEAYTCFQAYFRPNKNTTKMYNITLWWMPI